jgi:hypothetical protein
LEEKKMKKLALLALALLILPGIVNAQCSGPGVGMWYYGFEETNRDVIPGEVVAYQMGPANLGTGFDDYCVHYYQTSDWLMETDPPEGECHELEDYTLWWQWLYITVPCEVETCDLDTIYGVMYDCDNTDPTYCAVDTCVIETVMVILHVVDPPPALYVMQDSLYLIEQGQTAAFIPFSICNGDPCADPTSYEYNIEGTGHISAVSITDIILDVPGGECGDVYAVIDAGLADVCDLDTLTIVAWDAATGTVYDTCVQIVHVIAPIPVPLFSTPVVTILVLAMILSAAVFMRRRAASRA